MNLERLRILYDYLAQNVPAERFDMNAWQSECGTKFCAGGWAAQIPEFQAVGLFLEDSFIIYHEGSWEYDGFHALEKFFDLPYKDCKYLFACTAKDNTTKEEFLQRLAKYT